MTDRDTVERFAAIVGVGGFYPNRCRRRHEKPMHEWVAQTAADVVYVVDLLLPHLGQRRQNKALEVRLVATGIRPHDGRRLIA